MDSGVALTDTSYWDEDSPMGSGSERKCAILTVPEDGTQYKLVDVICSSKYSYVCML